MKKQLVLTTTILLLSILTFAQDFDKFKIGFKINPNVAWLVPQDNNIVSQGSKARFGYGLSVDVLFAENYALGTGLNIDNSGGHLQYYTTISETSSDTTVTTSLINRDRSYNLKYLEIPVTLKLRTNEIGYFTYWFQFGLGLGINIKAQADDTDKYMNTKTVYSGVEEIEPAWGSAGDFIDTQEKLNIKEEIKPLRMGLIIGAGAEYNISDNTSILVGVSYNNGFTNIFKKDQEGIETDKEDYPVFNTVEEKYYKLKANGSYIALNIGVLF